MTHPKLSISSTLIALLACGAFVASTPTASAQDTTARPRATFNLGKALNRIIFDKPRARQSYLEPVNRVHYKTNVYQNEGKQMVRHETVSSHGLFVHFDLGTPNPKLKAGHSLAE